MRFQPFPIVLAIAVLAIAYGACTYCVRSFDGAGGVDASSDGRCVEYTYGIPWPCNGSQPDQASPVDTSYDASVGPAPQGRPELFADVPHGERAGGTDEVAVGAT